MSALKARILRFAILDLCIAGGALGGLWVAVNRPHPDFGRCPRIESFCLGKVVGHYAWQWAIPPLLGVLAGLAFATLAVGVMGALQASRRVPGGG